MQKIDKHSAGQAGRQAMQQGVDQEFERRGEERLGQRGRTQKGRG